MCIRDRRYTMEDIKIDSQFCYRAKKVIQKFPNRALDLLHCFSPSQEKSKRWLVENLNDFLSDTNKNKFFSKFLRILANGPC